MLEQRSEQHIYHVQTLIFMYFINYIAILTVLKYEAQTILS